MQQMQMSGLTVSTFELRQKDLLAEVMHDLRYPTHRQQEYYHHYHYHHLRGEITVNSGLSPLYVTSNNDDSCSPPLMLSPIGLSCTGDEIASTMYSPVPDEFQDQGAVGNGVCPAFCSNYATAAYTIHDVVTGLRAAEAAQMQGQVAMAAGSTAARLRRQRIRERLRLLEKEVPLCEARLDTAAMLQEAFQYVQFLQSQLLVLDSMPQMEDRVMFCECGSRRSQVGSCDSFWFRSGGGRCCCLTRQQMLQALLRSPVVQRNLFKSQMCLVTEEQLRWVSPTDHHASSAQMLHGSLTTGFSRSSYMDP